MKTCEQMQELISLYIDNELNPSEAEELEKHLSSCEHCKKELEDIKQVVAKLKSLEELELPNGYHEELILKLNSKKGNTLNIIKKLSKYAAVASVFLLFIWVGIFNIILLDTTEEYEAVGFAINEDPIEINAALQGVSHTFKLDVEDIEKTFYMINNLPGNTTVLDTDENHNKWIYLEKQVSSKDYNYVKDELKALGAVLNPDNFKEYLPAIGIYDESAETKNQQQYDTVIFEQKESEQNIYMFIMVEEITSNPYYPY